MKQVLPTLMVALAAWLLPHPLAACSNCISTVPPQPADGVYSVSAEAPNEECFWMYLGELRPGENMSDFLHRVLDESHEQQKKRWELESYMGEDGYKHRYEGVPEVHFRGIMMHNPQAPEGCRDIPLPWYRDNHVDMPGDRARHHSFFLGVELHPQGIKVRRGSGYAWRGIVATEAPKWWPYERAEEFFAALPDLLRGDPEKVHLPLGVEELPPHLQERIKSGRRMVMLYADKALPAEAYWTHWARIVELAGAQCVEYCSCPDVVMSPDTAYARNVVQSLDGGVSVIRSAADAFSAHPRPQVEPCIELPEQPESRVQMELPEPVIEMELPEEGAELPEQGWGEENAPM